MGRDNDFDELPRRRRRNDDDDGRKRRRRRPEQKSSPLMAIVLGAAGFLIVAVTIVGVILYNRGKRELFTGVGAPMVLTPSDRLHDSNNLKEVTLGVHQFNDANHGRLPGPFVMEPGGQLNRGLSWRVSILPFMEGDALYKWFKLDQAWDTPANRPAAETYVRQYSSNGDPQDYQTRFRAFVGPGTAFENERLSLPRSFTDGTANTLLAVETTDRVPWAAAQEIPYQPGGPLPALGHPSRDVILLVMADGSVRAAKKTINPQILHALITRNGGETLPPNWDQ